MHTILTDLIVCMPVRIREIRLRDEDLLRNTGYDPSSNGHGFANFLLLIADLYNHPGSKFHSRLSLEYWWPMGEISTSELRRSGGMRGNFTGLGFSRNIEMESIRQVLIMRVMCCLVKDLLFNIF